MPNGVRVGAAKDMRLNHYEVSVDYDAYEGLTVNYGNYRSFIVKKDIWFPWSLVICIPLLLFSQLSTPGCG